MPSRRRSRFFRILAVAAALASATVNGALPACMSLLAEAAAPCNMHGERNDHGATAKHTTHSSSVSAAPSDMSCSTDQGSGCATAGVCPTGTTPTPAVAVAWRAIAPVRPLAFATPAAQLSFVGSPLSPPPQA